MQDNRTIIVSVKPTFETLNYVRGELVKAMADADKLILEGCEIVSWELLENAIKYGVANDKAPEAIYNFVYKENEIFITVSNGLKSLSVIEHFISMMEKIKVTKDRTELYIKRLTEILDNPSNTKSQLGLYKIMAETEFNLNYKVEDMVLTVYANLKLRK